MKTTPTKIDARTPNDVFAKKAATFGVKMLSSDVAEISLYDEIGMFGVTAAAFKAALDEITASKIVLNINSPGGDVFDGVSIFNDLLDHEAYVEVRVSGLAASAASVVAMAGDKIVMGSGAFLMIHNAWSFAIGDHREMASRARLLKKIDGTIAATYAEKSGADLSEITEMMADETWLTADEAISLGLADEKTDHAADASASFDLSVFKNAPADALSRRQPEASPKKSRKAKSAPPAAREDYSALVAALSQLNEAMLQ